MKKIIITCCTILIMCFMFSCNKDVNDTRSDPASGCFIYPIKEYSDFDVDEEGSLYYLVNEDTGKTDKFTDSTGQTIEAMIYESKIYKLDSAGKVTDTFPLEKIPAVNELAVDKNRAYYTSFIDEADDTNAEEISSCEVVFYEYSFDTRISEEIYRLSGFDSIKKIDVIGDFIYFMGIDQDRRNKNYKLANNEDNYNYAGEVIGIIDINAKTMSELPIELPITFSKTPDNKLMVYAYDSEGGYYFAEYNKEGISSDKTYRNLKNITGFAVCNKNKDIISGTNDSSVFCLSYSPITEGKGIIELMPYVYASKIQCQGEYVYYTNGMNSNKIERIKYKGYILGDKAIHMVSSTFAPYTPFGCGYNIEREYPTAESFALSVLSYDDSYDICLMDSRQDISENIRDKGAFYPLNEVAGVKEYLDACFPYIKEAATTADGDIWMFPVAVDIPCFVYNESLCNKYGSNPSASADFTTLVDTFTELSMNSELENSYNYSNYILTEIALHQYLRENKVFDTEKFRSLAPILKDKMNYMTEDTSSESAPIVANMLMNKETENFMFELDYDHNMQQLTAMDNNLRVCGVPQLIENKANIARCIYLCINPSAVNLSSALRYISSLSSYLMSISNSMMLKDRTVYPETQVFDDLYSVYSNGEIVFTLPNDLFMNDFEKYLKDKIDLDTLIKEADRKVDTFLKE